MDELITLASLVCGIVVVVAIIVSVVVQMTKSFIPMPTKAWVMIVSFIVVGLLLSASVEIWGMKMPVSTAVLAIIGSMLVSYIAIFGFDTFKELAERVKNGKSGIKE